LGTQECNKCGTIKNYDMTLWAEFITLRIATTVEHTILKLHSTNQGESLTQSVTIDFSANG